MLKAGMLMRKLPQYAADKFITCHVIRNTQARFSNRKRPDGWLTPSARHLVQTHLNLVHLMQKYLPVTDIGLEVNRFAFMQLEDPSISGVDFQNGPLKGFDDLHAAVRDLQDGSCLLCKKEIEHFHHIVPRSKHGSNTIGNIAGLCTKCHGKVYKDENTEKRLKDKKKGLDKKYGALSILNQAVPFICKELETEFGKEHVHYCTGRETALLRRSLGYHKTKEEQYHEVDAWCIGALSLDRIPENAPDFTEVHTVIQFRRQDRALIQAQTSRSYKLDGETVAWNRKKRTDQKNDSLEDWYLKQVRLHGQKEADRMRSRLKVKISQRRYNDLGRVLPGAVFLHKGERHVMSGTLTEGKYMRAVGDSKTNYPVKECRIIKRNRGLVFIN